MTKPGPKPRPLKERFLEKVDKNSHPGGCWVWTASVSSSGYGKIGTIASEGWKLAHRVSWRLFKGEIPKGLCALHKCDNRFCVNPDHLFLGTRADNLADMAEKGRSALGSKNGNAKLNREQVITIRAMAAEGVPQRSIANQYGIGEAQISRIVNRTRWQHI